MILCNFDITDPEKLKEVIWELTSRVKELERKVAELERDIDYLESK